MQIKNTTKFITVLVGICVGIVLILGLSVGFSYARDDGNSNNSRSVIAHYHKDVDCTITAIDARWCIYYWKVDIKYANNEYGLEGQQTLTYKDGADFKDARVGDHIAVILLTDLDNDTQEVLNRRLGNIVISAGYDDEPVHLR